MVTLPFFLIVYHICHRISSFNCYVVVGAHPRVRPQKSRYVARAHTRVRPYGVKVRFGLFARLQVRRTVFINRIFQCDRRGDPCGLPFAAKRQNDSRKGCHYNVKDRLRDCWKVGINQNASKNT